MGSRCDQPTSTHARTCTHCLCGFILRHKLIYHDVSIFHDNDAIKRAKQTKEPFNKKKHEVKHLSGVFPVSTSKHAGIVMEGFLLGSFFSAIYIPKAFISKKKGYPTAKNNKMNFNFQS